MNEQVVILGGGIGGLAMSLSLEKMGIAYHLIERSSEFTEVGAGIGLTESTLSILDQQGVKAEARANSMVMYWSVIADYHMRQIQMLEVPEGVSCIHRAKLIDILPSALKSNRYSLGMELIGRKPRPSVQKRSGAN